MKKRVRDRADGEGTRKKNCETDKRAQKKTKIAARETAAAVEVFLVCPRTCNFMRTGKQ